MLVAEECQFQLLQELRVINMENKILYSQSETTREPEVKVLSFTGEELVFHVVEYNSFSTRFEIDIDTMAEVMRSMGFICTRDENLSEILMKHRRR